MIMVQRALSRCLVKTWQTSETTASALQFVAQSILRYEKTPCA